MLTPLTTNQQQWVDTTLSAMTLPQCVGQLLCPSNPRFTVAEWGELLQKVPLGCIRMGGGPTMAGMRELMQPLQEQSAIKYSAWETKGWAYYCSGDHPYAWNYNNGYIFSYTFDNTCFNITENVGSEGSSNKYDFTITNFCLKSESFVIKLACSDTAPPSSASRR